MNEREARARRQRRVQAALLAVVGLALLVILAAPLLPLTADGLAGTWWAATGVCLLALALQGILLASLLRQHREAQRPPALPRTPAPDFDRPWRGGSP